MIDDVKNWLSENRNNFTLLGICPIFPEIVKASFELAAEKDFPPMFVATPRQIDGDRGYTGWSQEEFVNYCEKLSENKGFDGKYLIARDHGGPFQSMRDRGDPSISLEKAMEYAKQLFRADVKAGFDIIHVDATEDPRIDGILDLEEVAKRTTELIKATETYRKDEGFSKVYYEVGTEEIVGGMTDPGNFEKFIDLLKENLSSEVDNLYDKLIFVVGQVGTTMRIDMENDFDPGQAQKLVDIVSKRNLFLKVHYTDWLDNSTLKKFPEIGVGGANVGPEFAAALIEGLEEMESKERKAVDTSQPSGGLSNFMEILGEESLKNAPWGKFVPPEIDEGNLESYSRKNKRDVAVCVGRYAMNESEVIQARERLYKNIEEYLALDEPDRVLIDSIKGSIARYVKSFNLKGSLS
ncbi:MAG: class II D-tagatose-bisphosphate aldolase non-catalytic subunit [Candidatus Hadarchaeia archaeon]